MSTERKRANENRPALTAAEGLTTVLASGGKRRVSEDEPAAPAVVFEVVRRLRRGRWTLTELPVR